MSGKERLYPLEKRAVRLLKALAPGELDPFFPLTLSTNLSPHSTPAQSCWDVAGRGRVPLDYTVAPTEMLHRTSWEEHPEPMRRHRPLHTQQGGEKGTVLTEERCSLFCKK